MVARRASQHLADGGVTSGAPRSDMMVTLEQQRKGGFFSVTDGKAQSVLLAGSDRTGLPPQTYVESEKKRLGMPYYMAALPPTELQTLLAWAAEGAPIPNQDAINTRGVPREPEVIQAWENFFNTKTWKAQWTSRYLFEHLFTAHLYFDESPGEFYELVHSKTAAPAPIEVIAARRPFEMFPEYENKFFYRLKKAQTTIVYKQHFVYYIKKETMQELKNLFWNVEWNGTEKETPFSFKERNPFLAFVQIPANSRYRWMLKNSRMLLDMDMRSDNCHGNGATGPLRDSFLSLFVRPESDVAVQFPEYFKEANPYLEMTNTVSNNFLTHFRYKSNQEKFSLIKNKYQQLLLPYGFSFEDIWDGEGGTQTAFYTINRHEKNVSVHDGAWGPRQRVSLLWDYATFERLYYNCVALTTLHDNVNDKVGTVLYLRDVGREAEEQLLSLVPDEMRQVVRDEWIQGEGRKHMYDTSLFTMKFNPALLGQLQAVGMAFDPKNAFASAMDYLLLKSGRFVAPLMDNYYLNPMHAKAKPQYAALKDASIFMSNQQVAGEGNRATHFPNVSYLIVRGEGDTFTYYTIAANRFYKYINYMPLRNSEPLNPGRDPKRDWMSIQPGIVMNYPGKIYMVDQQNVSQLIADMKNVNSPTRYKEFDRIYGLQKMSSDFWTTIDRLQANFIQADPIENGSLDLGDYGVHDLIGSP